MMKTAAWLPFVLAWPTLFVAVIVAGGCRALLDAGDLEFVGTGGGGGGGAPVACDGPEKCPGSDSDCETRTCKDQVCGTAYAAEREPCDDDGQLCDGEGSCVECLAASDCTGGTFCDNSRRCAKCGAAPVPPGGACPAPCSSCTGNSTCRIVCSTDSPCDSLLTCPAGYACEVDCVGKGSCSSTIACPDDYGCEVVCNDNGSCSGLTVNCSRTGACKLTCDEQGACGSTTDVHCGDNACTAVCSGSGGGGPAVKLLQCAASTCSCVDCGS